MSANTTISLRKNVHVTKIWRKKNTVPKEIFNEIWLNLEVPFEICILKSLLWSKYFCTIFAPEKLKGIVLISK